MGPPHGALKSPEREGRANGVILARTPLNVQMPYDIEQLNVCSHHRWRRRRTVVGVRLQAGGLLRAVWAEKYEGCK